MGNGPLEVAEESYGVLVGWTHQRVNGQMILSIESVQSQDQRENADVDKLHLLMTLNQATVLGNFLLGKAGLLPPNRRKPGRLARWFGQ